MSYKLTEYKNVDFFTTIDTEEKAYWIGFICADGNISKDRNIFQINLSKRDDEHLKKLGKIFGKETYVGKCYNKGKGKTYEYSILSCCQEDIRESLVEVGIYPNKTEEDSVDVFDFIPENMVNHFVRGYFDGDGCITYSDTKEGKRNYCVSIAGSKNFLKELKGLFVNNIGVSNTKTFKFFGCDVIRWSGREQVNLIARWMYGNASIYLERKKKVFDECYKNNVKRGASNFRGVAWHKNNKKWLASISHNKKRINLGYYDDEREAALAYDEAVVKYEKPLYKLNFNDTGVI